MRIKFLIFYHDFDEKNCIFFFRRISRGSYSLRIVGKRNLCDLRVPLTDQICFQRIPTKIVLIRSCHSLYTAIRIQNSANFHPDIIVVINDIARNPNRQFTLTLEFTIFIDDYRTKRMKTETEYELTT